ncbi:MAG TPA: extensin family protein, partial [Pseudolabrys sp.]|nr:extensin family protein [Pseudolabrys sp.]
MKGGARFYLVGAGLLLALAGCGRGLLQYGERASWRQQAEVACLKSGAVKIGAGVVQIQPIEGPGMCGADFPLKVAALGESSRLGYADDPRPPGAIPNASSAQMPRWPASAPFYARPVQAQPVQVRPVQTQPVQGQQMRWAPGPPGIERPRYAPPIDAREPTAPAGRPLSIYAPGVAQPDDIPDDAILPPGRGTIGYPRTQPSYNAPVYEPPRQPRALPALGPMRGPRTTGSIAPAAVRPPATLACPLVSALDRWVSEGVQPAALRWFGSQVTEIKQISAYSCRGMVGAGTSRISEHAFGNALDVAGFTLADGRKVTVKDGWRGSPEEQGFLRDVQLTACENFNTVLAPGYNYAHYDHIHVDLMRRSSGRRPCRPTAIPGEVAAAKARAVYASKQREPVYTGSVSAQRAKTPVSLGALIGALPDALPGEDGYVADEEGDDQDDAVTGSIPEPVERPKEGGTFGDAIARWFGRSSTLGRQN